MISQVAHQIVETQNGLNEGGTITTNSPGRQLKIGFPGQHFQCGREKTEMNEFIPISRQHFMKTF